MSVPSASCLFYLFAGEVDYDERLHHWDPAVAVPDSDKRVPLRSLERVLMDVAIWDLIRRDAVRLEYHLHVTLPERHRRWREKLIRGSEPQPTLLLVPRHGHAAPRPHSLSGQLYSVIPSEGSSAGVAIIDWARGRSLPYEAIVSVACQEAVSHGIVSSERAPDRMGTLLSGYVFGAPRADASRLEAHRIAFTKDYAAWNKFYDDSPTEAGQLLADVLSGLRRLRPTTSISVPSVPYGGA